MNRGTFALIEQFMLDCMRDAAHDKEHVYRVLFNAMHIAKAEPEVEWDVLITAALLHDVSRPEQIMDPNIDHASHGADKAYAFLQERGFCTEFCEHVRQCIRTHRFRKAERPATIEAKILFDADKLDVAGAIGIARTLQYSGETGRPVYSRDVNGEVSDGTGDTKDSFFREYKFKLEHICDHFLTKRGRELALQRHQAAILYYESLLTEVRDAEGREVLQTLLADV